MHYPIDRLGQGTALQTDAYTAIGSRLEQLGYTTGPLPGDREFLVEAYLALQRARGEDVQLRRSPCEHPGVVLFPGGAGPAVTSGRAQYQSRWQELRSVHSRP